MVVLVDSSPVVLFIFTRSPRDNSHCLLVVTICFEYIYISIEVYIRLGGLNISVSALL